MMSSFVWSALIGAVFVTTAITLVLGSYWLARKLLAPVGDGDRTHDVASSVAARIVTLHGLILALVYAQELDDYKGIRAVLMEEAVAISDVYNDIGRYGGPAVAPIRQEIAGYLTTVVGEEWERLGTRQGLSGKAWSQWDGVYARLLDLTPANDRERYLSGRMRDRVAAIARYRQIRSETSEGGFGGLFWAPALLGLTLLAIPFYVYRPTRSHIVLLSIFGAYSGVILFFIFAFSNPFVAPGKLEPLPFERLLQGDIGKSLAPAGQ